MAHGDPARKEATLWMGDLEPYMDDNFIVHAFREALQRTDNVIREIRAPLNKVTGLPLGYAFVEFLDHNVAYKALQRLGGQQIPNSNPPKRFKLNTIGDKGSSDRKTEWSIWVGDLDDTVDDSMLYRHFAKKYQSTVSAKVVRDHTTGASRGFAFVRFSDETEQQTSMIELNNTEINGRRIKIRSARPHAPRHNYNNTPQQSYGDMSSYHYMMNQNSWYRPHKHAAHNTAQYDTGIVDEDDTLIEAVLVDEPTQINRDFVNMSGEVYTTLEASRWFGDIHPFRMNENKPITHFT